MPVTIKPAEHGANKKRSGRPSVTDPLTWLRQACRGEAKECKELLQSSLDPRIPETIEGSSNGFVHGALRAYNEHHHLRIRPEDVWFAILSQFSFFVNAHSEELREQFVAHKGKKELVLFYDGNLYTVDYGLFAKQMGELIEKNVVDPELRRWMMPAFTTTTDNDMVVASILLMGTTQKYFDFKLHLMCGLPTVTLLGEKSDWELILTRLEKLKEYGKEPTNFYRLLKAIISAFVKSFDKPTSKDIISFWQRIAHYKNNGSGPLYLSGWITAFCFWDKDGKCLYRPNKFTKLVNGQHHMIDRNDVPPGYTSVPVTIVQDGEGEFESTMVAGSVGWRYTSSSDTSLISTHCNRKVVGGCF